MKLKTLVLQATRAVGAFATARRVTRGHLRILAYHGLWTTPGFQYGNHLFMQPEKFEQRMRWLKRSGHPVLPLDEAVSLLESNALPANAVVITIDDGWRSTYTHMLPVLKALGLPATLYVTTWYVDNRAPIFNKAADYALQICGKLAVDWQGIRLTCASRAECETSAAIVDRALNRLPAIDDRIAAFKALCNLADVDIEPWWTDGQFHLMTRAEISAAAGRGLDIQLHSHRHQSVDGQCEALAREIDDNRRILAECVNETGLVHFCYPSGTFAEAAPPSWRRPGSSPRPSATKASIRLEPTHTGSSGSSMVVSSVSQCSRPISPVRSTFTNTTVGADDATEVRGHSI